MNDHNDNDRMHLEACIPHPVAYFNGFYGIELLIHEAPERVPCKSFMIKLVTFIELWNEFSLMFVNNNSHQKKVVENYLGRLTLEHSLNHIELP